MIRVEGLRKEYAGFEAVAGSTFSVEPGEVFGLVGPNGAGKTTTLKMLAGLVEPTAGSATVNGFDASEPEMRATLGFLPEESPLYEEMTAHSYLRFFADLYDVPREVADRRIGDALDRLDLDHRDRALGNCSKGMKRKVAIARSLVNDPDVVVYDEPASGLDPLTTNEVVSFTRELAERGKTVVFSAHNLYHVEDACDRVAIMRDGEIVARGTLADIRSEHGTVEYHVYTTVAVKGSEVAANGVSETSKNRAVSAGRRSAPPNERAADAASEANREGSETEGDRHLTVVESMDAVEGVRERAEAAGGEVADIRTREPSLERVFLDVAGNA